MAAPRRSSSSKSAIRQVPWRDPRPAPIVLVSGPEDVCAERAIAGLRDYVRAEDPAVEVTDLRADDYVAGTLLTVTSPSLFGEPRLVRVFGVEKASDSFLTEAVAYLETRSGAERLMLSRSPAPRSSAIATATTSPLPSSLPRTSGSRLPPSVRSSRRSPTTSPSSPRHASNSSRMSMVM